MSILVGNAFVHIDAGGGESKLIQLDNASLQISPQTEDGSDMDSGLMPENVVVGLNPSISATVNTPATDTAFDALVTKAVAGETVAVRFQNAGRSQSFTFSAMTVDMNMGATKRAKQTTSFTFTPGEGCTLSVT